MLAAQLLRDFEAVDSEARAKKNIVAAIEQVAKRLGNTRAVCRKCYVHPAVIDAYLDGSMMRTVAQRAQRTAKAIGQMTAAGSGGPRTAAAPAGDAPSGRTA